MKNNGRWISLLLAACLTFPSVAGCRKTESEIIPAETVPETVSDPVKMTETVKTPVVMGLQVSLKEDAVFKIGETVTVDDITVELLWDDRSVTVADTDDLRIVNGECTEPGKMVLQVAYREELQGACTVSVEYPEWVELYAAYLLQSIGSDAEMDPARTDLVEIPVYALAMLDADDVPELILQEGWDSSHNIIQKLLQLQDGTVQELGTLRGGRLQYVYRENCMFAAESCPGAKSYVHTWKSRYYKIEDNTIVPGDSYSYFWTGPHLEQIGWMDEEIRYEINGKSCPEAEAVPQIEAMPACNREVSWAWTEPASLSADLWQQYQNCLTAASESFQPMIGKYLEMDSKADEPAEPEPDTAPEDEYPAWVEIYASCLEEISGPDAAFPWIEEDTTYALALIDDDDVPELFTQGTYRGSMNPHALYAIRNDEVVYLDLIQRWYAQYVYRGNVYMTNTADFAYGGRTWPVEYKTITGDTVETIASYTFNFVEGEMTDTGWMDSRYTYYIDEEVPEAEALAYIETLPRCNRMIKFQTINRETLQEDLYNQYLQCVNEEWDGFSYCTREYLMRMSQPDYSTWSKTALDYRRSVINFMKSCADKYDEEIYTFNLIQFDGDGVPELAVIRDPNDPEYPANDIRGVQIYRFSPESNNGNGQMIYVGTFGDNGHLDYVFGRGIIATEKGATGVFTYHNTAGEEVTPTWNTTGSIAMLDYDLEYRYTPDLVDRMTSENYFPE